MTRDETIPPLRCLWCRETLPAPRSEDRRPGEVSRCSSCGRGNRPDDLRTFHTLRPGARRLQTLLELVAIAGLAACFYQCIKHWRHLKHGDPAIVRPIVGAALVALALGYASRYVTRRWDRSWSGLTGRGAAVGCLGAMVWVIFLGAGMGRLEGSKVYVALALAAAVLVWARKRIVAALRPTPRRER